MAEWEAPKSTSRRHLRLPPSVPFIWEERPGIAKKNWRPGGATHARSPGPPIKLIASVPFDWEEEPGKPLPCFLQPEITSPLPIMYYQEYHDKVDNNKTSPLDGNGQGVRDQAGFFDMDVESFKFEAGDYTFSSPDSLMANCLVPSGAISTAVPALTTSSEDYIDLSEPLSPESESDSSICSYATGTGMSSFTGAAFLEYLFPLLPSNSAFLRKSIPAIKGSLKLSELDFHHFGNENNGSTRVRKPTTLGELIMLSRKRSYQRKAGQIRKQNSSMELVIKKAFGCFILGTGNGLIERLQRKRQQLMLKLM